MSTPATSTRAAIAVGVIAFGLSMVLLLSLLVYVLEEQEKACAPDLGTVDVPAEPVRVSNPGAVLSVRVGTWNTFAYNSTGRIESGLRALAGSADVIGLQELNPDSRRAAVRRAMAGVGWDVSQGNNSVQIIWNAARLKLLAQDSQKVFDVERIENGVAGTSIGPKSVQWVQLQDRRTGAVMFLVNHHIVPTIEHSGHPNTNKPRRLALYRKQMAAMLSVVAKLRPYGPVFVTGDFNIAAKADQRVQDPLFPAVQMRRAGLVSTWQTLGFGAGPTQGRRQIDYIWATHATAIASSQRVLAKHGSDHSPVVAVMTSRGATTRAPNVSRAPSTPAKPAAPSQDDPRLSSQTRGRPTTPAQVAGMSPAQTKVAAAIVAATRTVGRELGWSTADTDRAALIALTAAATESTMGANRGTRGPDLGIFQQRTLPGWYGTVAQVNDPTYATRAFLLGVPGATAVLHGLKDVSGWQTLPIHYAAQRVQRSGAGDGRGEPFGANYLRSVPLATKLLAALVGVGPSTPDDTGTAPCGPGGDSGGGALGSCPATTLAAEKVLTPDALRVLRCVSAQFPQISSVITYAGHEPDQSRAVDIMIPNWASPTGVALGTQIADWVKAHRQALGLDYVIWREHIWSVQRGDEGWRRCGTAAAHCYSGPDATAGHFDHVHVSVYGNRGVDQPATTNEQQSGVAPGAWTQPLSGNYRIGCGFGCYGGHTGQDFPAPDGTPVHAVTAGTVIRSESLPAGGGRCTTLPVCGGTRHRSYGNLLVIKAAGDPNITTWYAHLSARAVPAGTVVQAGQIIGAVGHEGHVIPAGPAGSHLHFEIRRGGTPIDPMPILRSKGVRP